MGLNSIQIRCLKNTHILSLLFLILYFPNQVYGYSLSLDKCLRGDCDAIWAVNSHFDDGLKSKSGALAEGFRIELEKLADYIFDEKLVSTIKDIQEMVDNNIITAEQATHRLLDHSNKIIDAVIGGFDESFEKSVDLVSIRVDSLQGAFFENLNLTWKNIGADIDCIATKREETINDLKDALEEFFKFDILGRFRSETSCDKEYAIPIKDKGLYTTSEAFLLWQCEIISQDTINTPAGTIAFHHSDVQLRASKLMCISSLGTPAPAARKIYFKYWLKAGRSSEIWHRASNF